MPEVMQWFRKPQTRLETTNENQIIFEALDQVFLEYLVQGK